MKTPEPVQVYSPPPPTYDHTAPLLDSSTVHSESPLSKTYVTFLSGSSPKWRGKVVPREIVAVSVLGSIDIDLRGAYLQPGETKIKCVAVLGDISIHLPLTQAADVSGVAVFGGFDDARGRDPRAQPGYKGPHPPFMPMQMPMPPEPLQPVGAEVVVKGTVVFGGVAVVDW
ncbi:hypothetical protein HDU93_009954 [Gonapodya sp. JEL0774]|nr:hypothetical protein HDU93_009954 [Gonapodya sp. JEL0774]